MTTSYDALLLVSFGGPESPDQVVPFLENVLRGKNVPRERMLEVVEHYNQLGGVSPINEQNRQLRAAIEADFSDAGIDMPVYWGNRNWHPMLADTLRQMADDGVERALAFFTSAFSSYSSCRQYLEDIERAQQQVGDSAPQIDRLRLFFNHPGFIEPMVKNVLAAIDQLPKSNRLPESERAQVQLLFTAHSIPLAMADNCDYQKQLLEACRLVAELVAEQVDCSPWRLVYQSRSGPPHQPWLEPDICDALTQRHAEGDLSPVVVVPVGFVSDHMEVLFDLDTEAKQRCDQLGIPMVRASTVGTDPRFVRMIRELVLERCDRSEPVALGDLPPNPPTCSTDCCRYTPQRPTTRPA